MKVEKTEFEGMLVIKPDVFEDNRGKFLELYHKEKFAGLGIPKEFVQDNQSISKKGVLRGLHFQIPPFSQGKLVFVVKGKVLDVAVDLRKNSPTYKKYFSILLSEENKFLLWIPEGFAHGFLSLEEGTIFEYKCTNPYHKESEMGIIWNDAEFAIDWHFKEYGIEKPVISEKDAKLPSFKEIERFSYF